MLRALAIATSVSFAATLGAAAAEPPSDALAHETGVLLPVQDRVGDPAIADAVSRTLARELGRKHALVPTRPLRNALRRVRLRDARSSPPAALVELAESFDAGWFFSCSLLEAEDRDVPYVTVSAIVFDPRDKTLAWAGFRAASGYDRRRTLGRGIERDILEVASRAAEAIARDFLDPESSARGTISASDARKPGFVDPTFVSAPIGRVAVIPFDAVVEDRAGVVSEIATDAATAALWRSGVELVQPTIVFETLRRRGILMRGEMDELSRAAMRVSGQAVHLYTGAVERYELAGGLEIPDPAVYVATRVIAVDTGAIRLMHGVLRKGTDDGRWFGRNRTYAPSAVAERAIRAMTDRLTEIAEPRFDEADAR